MANKNAPFGLKSIGKVGQNKDNQGLSEYSIAAEATAIYQWDPVVMANTGTIAVGAAEVALLGSLNGVFYTDASTKKPTWANHLAASNTATDIVGFVCDDPYERFEIQSNNSGASAQTDIGNCADIVYAAGSSHDYISGVQLNDATLGTSDGQLKIIGVSKDPDNNSITSTDGYVNWVVVINEHFLKQVAGI